MNVTILNIYQLIFSNHYKEVISHLSFTIFPGGGVSSPIRPIAGFKRALWNVIMAEIPQVMENRAANISIAKLEKLWKLLPIPCGDKERKGSASSNKNQRRQLESSSLSFVARFGHGLFSSPVICNGLANFLDPSNSQNPCNSFL